MEQGWSRGEVQIYRIVYERVDWDDGGETEVICTGDGDTLHLATKERIWLTAEKLE